MVNKSKPQLKLVAEDMIPLDSQLVSYVVKRSARARRVRLEIKPGTALTVIIPRTYPLEQVPDIIKSKQRWIMDTITKFDNRPLLIEGSIMSGDVVSYLGKELKVVAKKGADGTPAQLERNRLVVNLAYGNGELTTTLKEWYQIQAVTLIQDKVDWWSPILGVSHNKITIRGQRSRWGSCSRKGNLSFNWKLSMAPEAIINYVVIHELAHLKQMNHSKKFWQIVADYCPEWRDCKKWLRNHEAVLTSGLFAHQMKLAID